MVPTTIGRYEIVRELGRGAMGIVYEARDPNIGRTVALKTIRVDVAGVVSPEVLRRFRNEAKAAGNLNHPNIVTVYDAGEHEGLFYMALERMEGSTLQELLARRGRLPIEQVVDIVRQVGAGLDFAHSRGIIHRDVKPANIMFAGAAPAAGCLVKITDFGIANIGDGMTMTGTVVGTPNYMSPEQVLGKPLDGRSDLFSVGVMLYEMVTGERPFEGQSITTIMYKIVHEQPIPPRKLDATIHPGLSFVVERSLAKAPEGRYQSGAALGDALRNYHVLSDSVATAISAVPLSTVQQPPATAPAAPPVAPQQAGTPPRRSRRSAIVVLILCIAAAWGIYWSVRGRHKAESPREAPAAETQPAPSPPPTPPQPSADASGTGGLVERKPAQPSSSDKALMKLSSNPPTAEIWVDGNPTGKRTPAELELGRGEHTVAVRMEGFQESTAKFRVKGGEEFEFAPTLSPAMPVIPGVAGIKVPGVDLRGIENLPGVTEQQKRQMQALRQWGIGGDSQRAIIVNSNPRGARVIVDGTDTGKTTPAILPMKPGKYHVRVELDGYKPADKDVTVTDRKSGIVNVRLKLQ